VYRYSSDHIIVVVCVYFLGYIRFTIRFHHILCNCSFNFTLVSGLTAINITEGVLLALV